MDNNLNPYWPTLLPRIQITKRLDGVRHIEIWWSVPKLSRYVERYALEYLATFKGWAKRRELWCFDKKMGQKGWRLQHQEKFKPVEGTWVYD